MFLNFAQTLILIFTAGAACTYSFVNMHTVVNSKADNEEPVGQDVCMCGGEAPASESEYYHSPTTASLIESFQKSEPDQQLIQSSHLICEKCLLDKLKNDDLCIFSIKCPTCTKLISYECIIEYIRNVVSNDPACTRKGSIANQLATRMITSILRKLGSLTFVYSLRFPRREFFEGIKAYYWQSLSKGDDQCLSKDDEQLLADFETTVNRIIAMNSAGEWFPADVKKILNNKFKDEKSFYALSLLKPVTIEANSASFLNIFKHYKGECGFIRSEHEEAQIAFINAKILYNTSPTLLPRYASQLAYFLPYFLEVVKKSKQNPIVQEYIEEFTDSEEATDYRSKVIISCAVSHEFCSVRDEALLSWARELVRHPKTRLYTIIEFCRTISVILIGRKKANPEMSNGPFEIFEKAVSMIKDEVLCYDKLRFDNTDLVKLETVLLNTESEFLKETFQELKFGILTTNNGDNISAGLRRIMEDLKNSNNADDITYMVTVCNFPEMIRARVDLFEMFQSWDPLCLPRVLGLNEYVIYDLAQKCHNEVYMQLMTLDPDTHYTYVSTLIFQAIHCYYSKRDLDVFKKHAELIRPHTGFLKELNEKATRKFETDKIGDKTRLCAYAYSLLYNVILDTLCDSDEAKENKIDLPEIRLGTYKDMFDMLTIQLRNAKYYVYVSATFNESIMVVATESSNQGRPLRFEKKTAIELAENLIWSGIVPSMLFVPHFYDSIPANVLMPFLIYEYFDYCYYTAKCKKYGITDISTRMTARARNADIDKVVDGYIEKYRKNAAFSKELSVSPRKTGDLLKSIINDILAADRDNRLFHKPSIERIHPLVSALLSRVVPCMNEGNEGGKKITQIEAIMQFLGKKIN